MRLPEPTFFLDECLGTGDVPTALRDAGARVELLRDHFEPGVDDEEWLREVGKRGWIVLTKDKRIRRRESERRALEEAGVAAFVLSSGDLSGPEMGRAFANGLNRMKAMLHKRTPPFIATLDRYGRVKLLTKTRKRGAKRKPR